MDGGVEAFGAIARGEGEGGFPPEVGVAVEVEGVAGDGDGDFAVFFVADHDALPGSLEGMGA